MSIEWKASELPPFTIVRAPHPWVEGIEAYWAKNDDGTWGELEADHPAHINVSRQDELLDINYIESVPKSWYEEFKPVEGRPDWSVNREGHIRDTKLSDTFWNRHHIHTKDCPDKQVMIQHEIKSLAEVVRKAFA